ncbi:hypothetical protein AZ66_06950 [Paenibacillus sp. E194]|uniref:hypothetical protein n=1 Tax=Paenibacillus sp. E194 TaxID=1458845 RepID=UPI0005CB6C5C|nr:hypothetical protein [Paenibacillus sp. E194]KJB88492.1 hypothetical protein AZ66_06950 [Paenibacillus sp. E194]
MRQRNFVTSLVYLVFIIVLLVGGTTLLNNHLAEAKYTLEYNFVYIIGIPIVCFGGIGALLGLSLSDGSSHNKETRKIDTFRLLLLGLPAFIISLAHVWGYLGLFHMLPGFYSYLLQNDHIIIITNIILGHTLVSSIYQSQAH